MESSVQIAHFDNGRLIFNQTEWRRIMDVVGGRKLSIISINGPQRTGKSYMLTNILKYLLLKDTITSEEDWDWVTKKMQEKFTWRQSTERQTAGIQIWPQPFFIKKGNEDIAVILLDTQGNGDPTRPTKEDIVIFTLSCILCSTLIYNDQQFREHELQFLQLYTEYANLFPEKGSSSNLFFLIRDWQNRKKYNYGIHGANTNNESHNFFMQIIRPRDYMEENAKNVRKSILGNFKETSSCLLPHPGIELIEDDDDTSNLRKEFVYEVKKFITQLLNPENLTLKTSVDFQHTGISMRNQICDSLISAFNTLQDSVTSKTNIAYIWIESMYSARQKDSLKIYEEQMQKSLDVPFRISDKEITKCHLHHQRRAQNHFKNHDMPKSVELEMANEQKLNEDIDKAFLFFNEENKKKKTQSSGCCSKLLCCFANPNTCEDRSHLVINDNVA